MAHMHEQYATMSEISRGAAFHMPGPRAHHCLIAAATRWRPNAGPASLENNPAVRRCPSALCSGSQVTRGCLNNSLEEATTVELALRHFARGLLAPTVTPASRVVLLAFDIHPCYAVARSAGGKRKVALAQEYSAVSLQQRRPWEAFVARQ